MIIGDHDTAKQVFIVAEIGNNHEGSINAAKEMIAAAAECGADAVKFQTIVPELLVSSMNQKRIRQLRKFQLSYDQFKQLAKESESLGLVFFSTPFDIKSSRFLNTIQPVFKIASGDNTFFPLIDLIVGFEKPIMISTGFLDINIIKEIHERITQVWKNKNIYPGLAFLHCVPYYPTPRRHANLDKIQILQKFFPQVTIGYSDHTLGVDAAIYSVAAGARIVEKHFTLDKNYSDFCDHQLSADPEELCRMVKDIREVNEMFLTNKENLYLYEEDFKVNSRRSIAASVDLPAGTILSDKHFIWVRPGIGLQPGNESLLLGKRTLRPIAFGELIEPKDVESCVE
jgi:N,N'-diacetyllegionaminate synthase